MQFNYSFSFGPPPVVDSTLYAALPGSVLPVDAQVSAWSAADGSRTELMQPVLAAVLGQCAEFRSRGEHIAHVSTALGLFSDATGKILDALQQRDLLQTAERLLTPSCTRAPTLPAPLIAIRTCRRPQALRRLLDSLVADERRWGTSRRYVVIDDATEASDEAQTRAIVAGAAGSSTSSWTYLGASAQQALLPILLEQIAPAHRAQARGLFDAKALPTRSGARTWNWSLMLAAGESLSILDDDIVMPARRYADSTAEFEPLDDFVGRARYFDAGETIDLAELERDPWLAAQDLVGQPPAAVLAGRNYPNNELRGQRPERLGVRDPHQPILAAYCGIYGELAFDSSAQLNGPRAENLRVLWREPFRLERLQADRMALGVRRPRLTSNAVYTPFLIDARGLLPYAGTFGRADDTMFLAAAAAMIPGAAFVFMPHMLGHFPVEQRDRLARSREPLLLDVNGFIATRINDLAVGLRGNDRAARLGWVAAGLTDLAATTDGELGDAIEAWRQDEIAHLLRSFHSALNGNPLAPPAWRAHVESLIAVNAGALHDHQFASAWLPSARAAIAQSADAGSWWPELWQRAQQADFRTAVRSRTALA